MSSIGYIIKVSLQKGGIVLGFDAAVEDAIISKGTIDGFVEEVVGIASLQKQLSAIFLVNKCEST